MQEVKHKSKIWNRLRAYLMAPRAATSISVCWAVHSIRLRLLLSLSNSAASLSSRSLFPHTICTKMLAICVSPTTTHDVLRSLPNPRRSFISSPKFSNLSWTASNLCSHLLITPLFIYKFVKCIVMLTRVLAWTVHVLFA